METLVHNKTFIQDYFAAISGKTKSNEIIKQYTTDEDLMNHIIFFDAAFPKYELLADEITAEENRVIVRARMIGKHEGEFNGIPPTYRKVELPFAIGYTIEEGKIINHWMIADQLQLLDMLGVKQ